MAISHGGLVFTVISSAIAGLLVLIIEPRWIRLALERGLAGRDMNKPDRRLVAEAGGVWVVIAAAFGLLVLEALYIYLAGTQYHIVEYFALITLLLLASIIGMLDDFLGWKKGLPRSYRVAFTVPISLPLVAVKAGTTTISLPLIGTLDLGLLYPLVAVPIGVVGAANGFNMIAGFNGLEAGMGLLLMLFTAAYAYMKGLVFIAQAALVMAAVLLAFLRYNWYPARVFPGNTLTYGVGAYFATLVVLGNMEKFGLILFIPYFIKAYMYFRAVRILGTKDLEAFGVPGPNGCLKTPHRIVYSWGQLAIKIIGRLRGCAREPWVVALVLSVEAAIGFAALAAAAAGLL
ncbi:MraY family glycosyltransferase [Hyperthermus butylicus]|uniref:UDP-N-acetylglucosamine--dolichyl-phosphate N-acetylglucosaminephosphotransferase n=1 Tax=Hyperthermus butylicus (strain DSM 5456 / JCM 9403 / PLM1-5) TaxID=415426 RepID=A2BMP5_HYPBU|nr:glycosyltransferase 4 family protein [Hyperthermus butylicus]ABM81256.1 UDP-N-acetylmuramyl pentapeptide phosphotransferase [Hyperthermus butylicus DSM 5456]